MKKLVFGVGILTVVVVGLLVFYARKGSAPTTKSPSSSQTSQTNQTQTSGFNKQQSSLTDPSSIWVIVNKPHALNPINYVPSDLVTPSVALRVPGNESMQLRKVTASALEELFAAAKQDGLNLMLSSGYRSYNYQVNLYNGYVKSLGQTAADNQSARPGHSEHQTGLAADIEPAGRSCEVQTCFADTPEGKWLASNAYQYGFIIRYLADKVSVTGYEYEPWHIRYIGKDLSLEMHNTSITTLEEFFGVSGGPNYN